MIFFKLNFQPTYWPMPGMMFGCQITEETSIRGKTCLWIQMIRTADFGIFPGMTWHSKVYSKVNTTQNWHSYMFVVSFSKDIPAIFDYIHKITSQSKFYVVAHSQGTSSVMALLSERPEFNRRMHAVSLMAPVGYLHNFPPIMIFIDAIEQQAKVVLAAIFFTVNSQMIK